MDYKLDIWRLHPRSARIERAEKTLGGTANPAGVRFCKPFSDSNSMGFWLYPPVNVDIRWLGGMDFEHKLLEPFDTDDHEIVKSLLKPSDGVDVEKFCPASQGRTKFSFGIVEPAVVQMWTGLIFKTPPGYCLQIRNPINTSIPGVRVMEGILETDWMQYDIWTNLVFQEPGKLVELRRDSFPPLAQLIPIRRETIEGDWQIGRNEIVNRDDTEANRVFEYWTQYNHRKFGSGGKQYLTPERSKDGTTFFKERAEIMGKGFDKMEPIPEKIAPKTGSGCPFRGRLVKPQ